MPKHYIILVVVAAAVLALSGCGGKKAPVMGEVEPGKFVLLYSFEEGDEFELTKTRTENSIRTVMGSETETRSKTVVSYDFTVETVAPEGFGIAFEYGDRTRKIERPEPRDMKSFPELTGRGAALTVSPLGYLTDLRGFESLPEINLPEEEFYLGLDQYMNEIHDLFYQLPDKPVSTGNMWNTSETFTETFPMGSIEILVNERYKLMGKTKKKGFDCVRISNTFTVKITGQLDAGGMKFALALEGGGTDEIYFAYSEGMFVQVDGQWKAEGTASNAEMGISIPMENYYQSNVEVEFD